MARSGELSYAVIFSGQLLPGFNAVELSEIHKLIRLDAKKIAQLSSISLTRRPMVVKDGMGIDDALSLKDALDQAGLEVRIYAVAPDDPLAIWPGANGEQFIDRRSGSDRRILFGDPPAELVARRKNRGRRKTDQANSANKPNAVNHSAKASPALKTPPPRSKT